MTEGRKTINMEFQATGIMHILDKQCTLPYYQDRGIDELLRANPFTVTRKTAVSIYLLGYIAGKRAERARRRK